MPPTTLDAPDLGPPSISSTPVSLPRRIPRPDHPMFVEQLPGWVTEIRPHQWTAVREIFDAYDNGARVVFFDGPTGTGKTLIGFLVGVLMRARSLYICSGLTLQDQFVADFPAAVVKGRRNYPTESDSAVTADACTGGGGKQCWWCPNNTVDEPTCPYQIAKMTAAGANLAVLNSSYLLAEGMSPRSMFRGREFAIADECDTLESELLGAVEFHVGVAAASQYGLVIPKKGSHHTTIAAWIEGPLATAMNERVKRNSRSTDARTIVATKRLVQQIRGAKQAAVAMLSEEWVRDTDGKDGLVMKPISVAAYGEPRLWGLADRWLAMSATIISSDQLAADLGVEGGRGEEGGYESVVSPMTFPVENRPIIWAPIASMTHTDKWTKDGYEACKIAVRRIAERHPGVRILVHSVSYELTSVIAEYLRTADETRNRPIVTYRGAGEREGAIARYLGEPDAIIVAPSLDRGVDFHGDQCAVQVVCKIPFPNLGDKQVNARLHAPGGQNWYTVQACRKLVQMTGRGVRSREDKCVTYILDRAFKNTWNGSRHFLPKWWREAVDTSFPVRELKD